MHSMVVLLSLLAVLTGCGKEQPLEEQQVGQEEPSAQVQDGKVLVACFSFTGTTKTVATTLASLTDGTLVDNNVDFRQSGFEKGANGNWFQR